MPLAYEMRVNRILEESHTQTGLTTYDSSSHLRRNGWLARLAVQHVHVLHRVGDGLPRVELVRARGDVRRPAVRVAEMERVVADRVDVLDVLNEGVRRVFLGLCRRGGGRGGEGNRGLYIELR